MNKKLTKLANIFGVETKEQEEAKRKEKEEYDLKVKKLTKKFITHGGELGPIKEKITLKQKAPLPYPPQPGVVILFDIDTSEVYKVLSVLSIRTYFDQSYEAALHSDKNVIYEYICFARDKQKEMEERCEKLIKDLKPSITLEQRKAARELKEQRLKEKGISKKYL